MATPPRPAPVRSAAIHLLSAGAVKPAVKAVLALWHADAGMPVEVTFATAPAIAARLAAGERPDLVLAPCPALAPLRDAGAADGAPLAVGAVGVGIAVREEAPSPAIADAASLAAELHAAEAVVFNRASSGLHVERVLARLGLADALAGRVVRFADGASVMRRIASGQGREIGFGAVTEILAFRDRGVRFAGPLPADLQNLTAYVATRVAGAGEPARAFLAFLDSPPARAAMAKAGVR